MTCYITSSTELHCSSFQQSSVIENENNHLCAVTGGIKEAILMSTHIRLIA